MLRLIGLVVSIGLADSINPGTVGPALYLAAEERPRRSLMQFTVAVFAVELAGGALIALGPGQVLLSLVPHPGHTVGYILEIVAGVVMLIAAVVLWRGRERFASRELFKPRKQGKSGAWLGLTLTAVELPTAFPYFAAIAAIVGSGFDPARQLLLLVLYNICFVLPLIIFLVTLTVAEDRADRVLAKTRGLLQTHWPKLIAGFALLAGAFVSLLGVTGLASRGHGTVGHISRRLRQILHH
jgi:cytochrome c biogenesis protein CcdA